MILDGYLRREILKSALAVTVVLTIIAISNKVVRLLSRAANGQLPADWVLTLILVELPEILSYILPLCWLLGIILTISRMYSDSEMTVMYATGKRWGSVCKQIFKISIPIAILSAALSLFIAPFGDELKERLLRQDESFLLMQTLSPGRFVTLQGAKMVFYVQDVTDSRRVLKEVFIAEQPWGAPSKTDEWGVLSAKSGHIVTTESGTQYLELFDGARYEGTPGEVNYQIVEFETYGRKLLFSQPTHKNFGTFELARNGDKKAWAEIAGRISMPISVLIIALMALPLSRVQPRSGRFAKIIPAVIVFIVYFNAIIFVKRAAIGGSFPLWYIIFPHIAALVVALLLMAHDSGYIRRLKNEKI